MTLKDKIIFGSNLKPDWGLGLTLLFCFFFSNIYAQQPSLQLSGGIMDKNKASLPGVIIEVIETGNKTVTDQNGNFTLKVPKKGLYTLKATLMGFQSLESRVEIKNNIDDIVLELTEQALDLEETVIYGKSETTELREQAIKAGIIDLKDSYSQPSSLNELINRSAGVRIRQTGGLGSTTDISLNGFQGKSIRYFKDGIPMDYLGEGFSIASLPVNMLERVEVYKGVLPVALGSDALGGALNLVTRKPKGHFAEFSYEIASFNTHRFNLNGYYEHPSNKWFAGMEGFFNHSDNNYKAEVKVTDPETRNQSLARLSLFHNAFTGFFVQGFAGVRDAGWTDELRLELSSFEMLREQQHPALMTDPYGAITGKQHSLIPSVRYKKRWKNLSVDQFLVYNNLIINRTDTLQGQYDWHGNLTIRPDRLGESNQPSQSHINNYIFTSRTNFSYRLNEHHSLELNNVFTKATRKGEDPYGPTFSDTGIDVLSLASTYSKLVSSLGWQMSTKDKRWENLLMFKSFNYQATGVETWQARPVFIGEVSTIKGNNWGVGTGLKFQPATWRLFRFSAEYANRLPDHTELFGNGIWIVQNFSLEAEKSLNLNLGMRTSNPKTYTFEANAFYRLTESMILLVPIQAPYARYENQENIRGFGLELDGDVQLAPRWQINANATWQELRLFGIENSTDSWKNGSRLRNTPYLFGNLGINYVPEPVFSGKGLIKLYAFYSFLKEFYLETIPRRLEPKGLFSSANVNTALIIPSQHLVNTGFNLSFPQHRLALGGEIKNLLNRDQFDNYRVQRAGRSLHLKLNYSIY